MDKADLNVKRAAILEVDSETAEAVESEKKSFIKPEISAPVDVLEATTFFQALSSGATN